MAVRFAYERLSPEEFGDRLKALDLTPTQYATIFGHSIKTVTAWTRGDDMIPPAVHIVLSLLERYAEQGAVDVAKFAAADILFRDNEKPELGEFPMKRFWQKGGTAS